MNPPPWLRDEPEIVALLGAVVDRFDQQPGAARERAIVIGVARALPALERNDAQADQTWEFIRELERRGVLAIRLGRRGAYDPPWYAAKLSFNPASEAVLRQWLDRPATAAPMQQWRAAVALHAQRFPGGHEPLLNRRLVIPGRTPEEIVAALARLADIEHAATMRQLSTHIFWGDSKLLDDRIELIAALFPALQIRDRPIVVAVHLPLNFRGVLFIENQDTYTAAIDGQPPEAAEHALVYMAGFRGAAARIRLREGACLHFGGPGMASRSGEFERGWFNAEPFAEAVYFWGDLDFAGMQILKSLRSRFPTAVAWRPGYEPMLAELRSMDNNPMRDPDRQRQVDPLTTGCDYADDELLPAIRRYGFRHQERISMERTTVDRGLDG